MTESWLEISLTAPATGHARLLATTVVPFLSGLRDEGLVRQGFFLRELGGQGTNRVLLQVEPAPGADIEERVRSLGHPDAAVGPATTIPLTGPVFGGADLGPVTRTFLSGAAPLLGDVLTRSGHDRSAMLSRALDLMTAHLPAVAGTRSAAQAALPAGLPLSYLSFRSHAEAFIGTSKDSEATRLGLQDRYDAVRHSVDDRVGAIFAQLAGGEHCSADAQSWHDLVRATKPQLVNGFETGSILAHTEYSQVHLRERTDFAGNPFHRTAGESAGLQAYLSNDTSFLATRLLSSLLYLSLHTVGVSLAERFFLCFAIASACEGLFEVDGLEILAGITGRPPQGAGTGR